MSIGIGVRQDLEKFIVRAYCDGTDFIGTDIHRDITVPSGRTGFGDMIQEISNLYHRTKKAAILCPSLNPAYQDFLNMLDMTDREYLWNPDTEKYNLYVDICKTNEQLALRSGRKLVMPHPNTDDYVKMAKERFVDPESETFYEPYVTYQSKPRATKCEYGRKHVQDAYLAKIKSYGIQAVDVDGLEELGIPTLAWIIDNAVAHVGIDSGMTHFALTVKDKNDVKIIVPEDRITGVSYRWINRGYGVELV